MAGEEESGKGKGERRGRYLVEFQDRVDGNISTGSTEPRKATVELSQSHLLVLFHLILEHGGQFAPRQTRGETT